MRRTLCITVVAVRLGYSGTPASGPD